MKLAESNLGQFSGYLQVKKCRTSSVSSTVRLNEDTDFSLNRLVIDFPGLYALTGYTMAFFPSGCTTITYQTITFRFGWSSLSWGEAHRGWWRYH